MCVSGPEQPRSKMLFFPCILHYFNIENVYVTRLKDAWRHDRVTYKEVFSRYADESKMRSGKFI